MRTVAAIALAASLAASPAAAQMAGGGTVRPAPVDFGDDVGGYGRALIEGLMPGQIDRWAEDGVPTRVATARLALNGDRQPEFAVRVENVENCDRFGCVTYVFMLVGRDWRPVLEIQTATLAVGAPDARSGMAALLTDGGDAWAWDGEGYDIVLP